MKFSALGKIVTPALLAGALLATLPATAFAQGYPGNGNGYGYGDRGGFRADRADVTGVVTYYNRFDLRLRVGDRHQYVRLHQGTIIEPTGLTLRPGMLVNVSGFRDRNGTFEADRIDLQRRGRGWRY